MRTTVKSKDVATDGVSRVSCFGHGSRRGEVGVLSLPHSPVHSSRQGEAEMQMDLRQLLMHARVLAGVDVRLDSRA